MRFRMIDRIDGYEEGRSLTATKVLARGEEYLADHFADFPIMPGVLMLEALVQAGAWLMRLSDGCRGSVILLTEVRAVRYGNAVEPGDELAIEVEIKERTGDTALFCGTGRVGERKAVVGQFTLTRIRLEALGSGLAGTDAAIGRYFEEQLPALMECGRRIERA
ncbi:MAG: beta-hydroxyacyl-ACP dehydratase [Candidatus Aureabacteria bacterium]|nr:beta-hydroxyacyl-ACP dehydratase [Candidatus Auribacterota bacterium]